MDEEDLARREHLGEVMPYERALIPHLDEIRLEFRDAIDDHGAGHYDIELGLNQSVDGRNDKQGKGSSMGLEGK